MKKQSRKVAKRCLAFLMVLFLLSINSFAAVVSDNDGSAFITKAEFDSLKNNFQSQIDSYNTSLDSKIDGAIAQYLAGIRIDDKAEVRFHSIFKKNTVQWYEGSMTVNKELAFTWPRELDPITLNPYIDNTYGNWIMYTKNSTTGGLLRYAPSAGTSLNKLGRWDLYEYWYSNSDPSKCYGYAYWRPNGVAEHWVAFGAGNDPSFRKWDNHTFSNASSWTDISYSAIVLNATGYCNPDPTAWNQPGAMGRCYFCDYQATGLSTGYNNSNYSSYYRADGTKFSASTTNADFGQLSYSVGGDPDGYTMKLMDGVTDATLSQLYMPLAADTCTVWLLADKSDERPAFRPEWYGLKYPCFSAPHYISVKNASVKIYYIFPPSKWSTGRKLSIQSSVTTLPKATGKRPYMKLNANLGGPTLPYEVKRQGTSGSANTPDSTSYGFTVDGTRNLVYDIPYQDSETYWTIEPMITYFQSPEKAALTYCGDQLAETNVWIDIDYFDKDGQLVGTIELNRDFPGTADDCNFNFNPLLGPSAG